MARACTSSNSSRVVQMHSARSTCASAMACRIWGNWDASSGKLRWQWESTNMARARAPHGAGPGGAGKTPILGKLDLDGLRRAFGRQVAAEDFLDLHLEQLGLVVRGKAHADTLGAVGGSAGRRDPRHLARHRIALRIVG